jgi:hypothetical protein
MCLIEHFIDTASAYLSGLRNQPHVDSPTRLQGTLSNGPFLVLSRALPLSNFCFFFEDFLAGVSSAKSPKTV